VDVLVDSGTGVNAIAARASATVEWRSTDQPELDRQDAALAGLEVTAGLRLSVERLDGRPACSVRLAHPLVAAIRRARRSIGLPETAADGPADTNAAPAAGIPAIALGCCEGENMQAPAERIRAGSIVTGARQLRAVLQEVLELAPRAARN
jgi:acetylornithine deacetylase/succinyl-diaminopimelate desuccinylase-like protein